MPIDISFNTDTDKGSFATKTYADQNYINVEGDTLQGDLDLNNHKITNVGKPTADKDCATKHYIDQQINATNNLLSGCIKGTMLTIKVRSVSNGIFYCT